MKEEVSYTGRRDLSEQHRIMFSNKGIDYLLHRFRRDIGRVLPTLGVSGMLVLNPINSSHASGDDDSDDVSRFAYQALHKLVEMQNPSRRRMLGPIDDFRDEVKKYNGSRMTDRDAIDKIIGISETFADEYFENDYGIEPSDRLRELYDRLADMYFGNNDKRTHPKEREELENFMRRRYGIELGNE